jgi:hypothetical protein
MKCYNKYFIDKKINCQLLFKFLDSMPLCGLMSSNWVAVNALLNGDVGTGRFAEFGSPDGKQAGVPG